MKPEKIRVLIRYSLFQIPALLLFVAILFMLRRIIEIPDLAVWFLIGCWVAKDVILYPIIGRYYDPNLRTNWFSMVGKAGTVKETLNPRGKVQVKGELWQAETLDRAHSAEIGEKVRVRGVTGLTLLVESEKTE
jgi:membrane protein implicated in regulation of membrane protease activity